MTGGANGQFLWPIAKLVDMEARFSAMHEEWKRFGDNR